jgi:V8-like Glu-specific endopeptidase
MALSSCALLIAVSLIAVSGCKSSNEKVEFDWLTVEPIDLDRPVPETLPELLDYSRLPELEVHYPDSRETVEPDEFPYTCIGQLLVYYPDGTVGQSTAFLVAPAHILTVADVFVGPDGEREYSHAVFTPGLTGATMPFGSAKVVEAAVPEKYIKEVNLRPCNVAVAVLDKRIGVTAGYFAFESIDPHVNTGVPVTTAGYARDTGASTMVQARGRFERYGYPGLWWNDLDADIGQNGSPVWIQRGDQPVVIAMLTRGEGRHSQAIGPAYDHEEMLDAIREWIADNPCKTAGDPE